MSLTEALRAGAPEAFGRLYDEYAERLHAYGHAMVGDEAADAVRDAFIAAARHPGAAPADDDALPVWLYALARSECVRRGALVRKPATTPSMDPLRRALARLRPEHREALALSLTLEPCEVARVIGVAPDTAELLVRVSRRRLEQAAASVLGTVRDESMLAALSDGNLHRLLTRAYTPPPRQRERVLFSCAAAERTADGALLFDQDGMPVPLDALFGRAEAATHPFTAVPGGDAESEPATGPLRTVDPDPASSPSSARRRVRLARERKDSFLVRRRDGLVEVAGLAACVAAATGALALWPAPHGGSGASTVDGTSLLIHRSAPAGRSALPVPSRAGSSSTPPPKGSTSKPGASPTPSDPTSAPAAPPATAADRPAPPPAGGPSSPTHPAPTHPAPTQAPPTRTPTPTPTPTPSDTPTGPAGDTPTPEPSTP